MYVRPISMRFVRGRSTPEIRAIKFLSLSLFVLLVRADHSDHPAAADHFALIANLFNRRSDLHSRFSLLQLLDDPAPPRVIRHQRHPHPIPDDHADVIASHGTRQVRRYLVPTLEFDPNQLA